MTSLAPIILFVYNRPKHTLRCLESLENNDLASDSILYIFCDGAKHNASKSDIENIEKVQEIILQKQWCREVIIKKQEHNIGLRNSVIHGVEEVLNVYNKAIIIEDDLLLSKFFLTYINKGLELFENDLTVSQISGHSFQLDVSSLKEDAYFLPLTTTWGWGTWKRIWKEIDFGGSNYQTILSDKKNIKAFNLDNSYDYYSMLLKQINLTKKISSWGIMFWLHTFKNNYKVLFPKYTLVSNIGFDGTGTHKANTTLETKFNVENKVVLFPEKIEVNERLFLQLKKQLRKQEYSFKNKLIRLYNKLVRK